MNKKSLIIIAVLAIALLAGWQWWASRRPAVSAGQPVGIGAVLPLTGGLSFLGVGEKVAMELAAADVNERLRDSGRRLEITYEDSKSNSRDGVNAAQKLLLAKPAAMVTALTIVSLAANPLLADAGIAQLALSVHPQITATAPNLFRPYYGFETEMKAIAELAGKSGAKRVAALWINVPESEIAINKYLAPALRASGGEVVASLPYGFETREFKSLLASIADKKPDLLVVIDFGNMVAQIIEAARLQGINNIVGSIGFLVAAPEGIKAATGLPFAVPAFVLEGSVSFAAFRERFKKASGGLEPNFDAVAAYDAVMLLAAGLGQVQGAVDGKSLLAGVASIRDFNGVAGTLRMNEDRNQTVPIAFATYSPSGALMAYPSK